MLIAKLNESVRRRGLAGFGLRALSLTFNTMAQPVIEPLIRRRKRRIRQAIDDAFDRAHGVNTAGTIPGCQLDGDGDCRPHATAYQAVYPEPFGKVLAQLSIDYQRTTFVDIGSGKGRAVLMACEYPFKNIVGVEFSPALHWIAELNCRKYKSATQRCRNIELRRLDAAEFDLPDGPLVLFMYNPFDEMIMRRVADNVAASLRLSMRPVTVLYFNPKVCAPWDGLESLEYVPVEQPIWPAFNGQVVGVWRTKNFAALGFTPAFARAS